MLRWKHILQTYVSRVSDVLEVCCKYFYNNVTKVDWDIAHVTMAIPYISSVCSKCFICIRHMLQVFYLYVAKVDLDVAYTCMLQAYVLSILGVYMYVASVFIWMLHIALATHVFLSFSSVLQVFQTYVANISAIFGLCFILVLQKQIWCCTWYNRTHLLQPPTATNVWCSGQRRPAAGA
jgi:hypothetical protein